MAQGGYEPIAQTVLRGTHAQRLLLEYDDERSGDFSPLATVSDDTIVVLGLVTTKTSTMESSETIHARLRAASRYVPLECLALSPQCGFASVAIGNNITPEAQERKLTLVATVARQVWSD
jgi:5-methyltetrahydropteroyltriglutamate--homocysteine methyltransferase